MAIVEVRPIEKERWHGKSLKESIARPVKIEALYNVRTGKYDTGLSPEDQERLENLTGFDLSDKYIKDTPHPYWANQGVVVLPNGTKIFDDTKPQDEITIKMLKASELVANSMREYEEGKFPLATHVIFDEREGLEIKASKNAIKREAYNESSKLSRNKKVEIIQVLLNKGVRKQSDDYIDVTFDDLIESQSEKVLELIRKDKEDLAVHAMVLEGLEKNVLRKEGTSVYYMDDQLGFDVSSAVQYFRDPSNQKLKAEIINKLKP